MESKYLNFLLDENEINRIAKDILTNIGIRHRFVCFLADRIKNIFIWSLRKMYTFKISLKPMISIYCNLIAEIDLS